MRRHRGELFELEVTPLQLDHDFAKLLLDALLLGDVPHDFRSADDTAVHVPNWRDPQRYRNQRAVLPAPDRFKQIHRFTMEELLDTSDLLIHAVLGNQRGHGPADDFVGTITKQLHGTSVPASNRPVEVLA